MKKVFYTNDKVELILEDEPFASGGEGNIYRIKTPTKYRKFVAKLYHAPKRTPQRQRKVEYLVKNPPFDNTNRRHHSLIWPLGTLFERSGFAGILLPFAQGEKLELLCTPKIHKRHQAKWGRFDLRRPDALSLRLKICFNIAVAVHEVHSTDHYVLVDLKSDNIIIQPKGLVSIVDMDSVEIIDKNDVLYAAPVATPEFTPPEYYRGVQPGKMPIYETWDHFSVAVIFYKLLFGIHPFAGSCSPPYDKYTSLHQKIEHGLFVHSPSKAQYFKVIPPPHRKFSDIDPNIQVLFIRCFEDGHRLPDQRPDADEWCWTISPQPRIGVARALPSKKVSLGRVSYTKPLKPAPTHQSNVPAMISQKLPALPVQEFSNKHLTPRLITSGFVAFILFWVFARGMPFSGITVMQILSLFATNILVIFASYIEQPEVKGKRIAQKKRRLLQQKRHKQQKKVNGNRQNAKKLPSREKKLLKGFEAQQQQQLIKEKKQIEETVKNYRLFLAEKDKEARVLYQQEMEAIQKLEKDLTGGRLAKFKSLRRLAPEEQIKWLKKEKNRRLNQLQRQHEQQLERTTSQQIKTVRLEELERIDKAYAAQIRVIQRRIVSSVDDRNHEEVLVLKMLKNRFANQLRKQFIRQNAREIFGVDGPVIGVVCDYLERYGIRDAADYIGIDGQGRLQKATTRQYVKIPFLDRTRARALWAWREKIIKQLGGEPTVLPPDAKARLDRKYNIEQLKKDLFKLQQEVYRKKIAKDSSKNEQFQKQASVLKVTYEKDKQAMIKEFDDLVTLLEENQPRWKTGKAKIEAEFTNKHVLLVKTCEAKLAAITKSITQINEQTLKANETILKETMQKINQGASGSEVQALIALNQEINDLKQINQDFYKAKQELDSFKNIRFDEYLKEIAFLK